MWSTQKRSDNIPAQASVAVVKLGLKSVPEEEDVVETVLQKLLTKLKLCLTNIKAGRSD